MAHKTPPKNLSAAQPIKQERNSERDRNSYIKEEHTSSDESQIKRKSSVRRNRASVACTSCRDRRIRCVVPSSKKICIQCERSGTPCVIKDDDERRRPISRAYVHSLVERVSLLEDLLQKQGVTVPPATYPPETRQRPFRSRNRSSTEHVSSLSSTPRESAGSEDHTMCLLRCSLNQTQDEPPIPKPKKRSSAPVDTGSGSYHTSKRVRQDSLITPAEVKAESPIERLHDSVMQCHETFQLDRIATIAPATQNSFWPMSYGHTSGLTTLLPISQGEEIEKSAYSTWENDAFGFNGFDSHIMTTNYGDTLPCAHRYDASSPLRATNTNLDFMPLSISS